MHHLLKALITVAPKKWQRFMADSRMIKYYRVLRRLSQKVFLLGTRGGTLLFNKAMPLLFVATMSSLLYLICMKLGSMDFFQSFLSKIGCSLGSRVLLSRGLGCEGWLLLVLILSAFGIFDGTIRNMIPYVVVGILFFVCYLISMFGIFHFRDLFCEVFISLLITKASLFGSCCSNKWAALALECFLRALDLDWAPALMIGPYGTEASSSALDQGQRQQEIEEVFPTEAETSYSAPDRGQQEIEEVSPPVWRASQPWIVQLDKIKRKISIFLNYLKMFPDFLSVATTVSPRHRIKYLIIYMKQTIHRYILMIR
ncbi:hypothetical protein VitviT2T_015782 [Vitis vinifera]|uniref:Uncharacterized protein n=1 Tax=Vitis vinifera TaxID=29760 RepID=A0ABY9CNN9_VITVI|nr:hypothetical protein VitviT2T_015782 [Vitis vinifera]